MNRGDDCDLVWAGVELPPNTVDWDDWDNVSDETCTFFGDLNNHDQLLCGFEDWSSEWANSF